MIDKDRAARRSFRRQVKKFLGLLPFGDVHRHTKKPRRFAVSSRQAVTASPDPADVSIRKHDPILGFVAALRSYRSLHRLIARRAILRMQTFLELAVGNLLLCRELKELTNFVGYPDSVGNGIQFPPTEVRSFGGERNALFELM